MARTIMDIPTTLSDQEVGAKLAIFLLNNRFQKVNFKGEELFRIGNLMMRPGYLKVLCGGGMVHIEAFYVGRWGESDMDSYFDPHDLRKKLQPFVLELSLNQAGSEFQDTMLKNTAASQNIGSPPPGYASDPEVEEKRTERARKIGRGCLTALIIFLALLGGCAALIMLYPEPQEEAGITSSSADTAGIS